MNRTKLPRWMVVAPGPTRRRIMDTRRRVAVTGIHDPTHYTDQGHMARCELDSHADTCVLGSNFKLIELTGEVVDVVPRSTTRRKTCRSYQQRRRGHTQTQGKHLFWTTIKHCGMARRLPTAC